MSLIQGVRVLVEQFLSATADQIVEAVEKMISGYEEMFQSKREISRQQRKLDALLQPENRISEEAQLNLSVWEEDLLTEQQQEWNSCEVSVKHFLSVAADRIMQAVEKMISGYKREMHQSKREISQQCKMINALLQPEIRLTKIPGTDEIDKVPVTSAEHMPIEAKEEVPSPGFSEPENDHVWNANQGGDSDRNEATQSEEWLPTPSKQHHTLTEPQSDDVSDVTASKVCVLRSSSDDPGLPRRASHLLPVECLICKKKNKYGRDSHRKRIREKLSRCETLTAGKKILLAAEEQRDEPLLIRICGRDLAASEAMYHKSCYRRYTRCLSKPKRVDEEENPGITPYQAGYTEFCKTVVEERLLRNHEVIRLTRLNYLFKNIVRKKEGLDIPSYKSFSLKARLKKSHPCLKFLKSGSHYLVYVKDLTADEVIHNEARPPSEEEVEDNATEECHGHQQRDPAITDEMDKVEAMETRSRSSTLAEQIEADEEVPSPGFSGPEDDHVWNATQGGDSDRSEEWLPTPSKHRTRKNKKSYIICKVCGKSFHNEGSFLKHLESHPKDDCGLCGMHFKTEEDFELHLKTHNVKVVVCDVCGKCFARSYLEMHMRSHTGEKPFTCEVCGKSYTSCHYMIQHLSIHTGEKRFICEVCGKSFKLKQSLRRHHLIHTRKKYAQTHFRIRKNVKVVVCDVCGKCFSSQGNLKIHMRSHTGEKPFTCKVCGKSFTSRHYVTKHLTIHTGEKPFRCELCGKSFRLQYYLTRHHIIHTGEKPYPCTICSKHFIRYSTLRKHMQTHLKHKRTVTSTTPVYDDGDVDAEVITKDQLVQIICKMCGKDFHSKVSLVNHLESHPKDYCGLCGTHFNTEEDFELHLKTHKDEIAKICDVCGKCFAKPLYLELHMRSHTGEKRFKCIVCDKYFRLQSALTNHLRIHTGEKPFSCTTCSKCFKSKSNLRQHMKRCRSFKR